MEGKTAMENSKITKIIIEILKVALNQGNSCLTLKEVLIKTGYQLHTNNFDAIATAINELVKNGTIVIRQDKIALAKIDQIENNIVLSLKNLINKEKTIQYDETALDKAISTTEKQLKIKYDKTQKSAIKNAISNPISILTGGPGTGKTTIINGIIMIIRLLNKTTTKQILLAAPTGRAAKRMSEMTNMPAVTIHHLLGLGVGKVNKSMLNQINSEILIIDETSMVDLFLFEKLLFALGNVRHLVLIGDKDQLPSVKAGNVFSDLIASHIVPTTTLTQIHRQNDDSTIIALAHDVKNGARENNLFLKTKNYSFISCKPDQISKAIARTAKLATKHGIAKDNIQILSAMYKGRGGINEINRIMQKIMNKTYDTNTITNKTETFYTGDRILQLRNNPAKNVFNGQIGKIIKIDTKNKTVIADFDGQKTTLNKKDLDDITLAYAITVHKSQGSEFPLVILDLTMQNKAMLKRNLLYTAITRAKKNLIMIGQPQAFITALKTLGNKRETMLTQKLQEQLPVRPL